MQNIPREAVGIVMVVGAVILAAIVRLLLVLATPLPNEAKEATPPPNLRTEAQPQPIDPRLLDWGIVLRPSWVDDL